MLFGPPLAGQAPSPANDGYPGLETILARMAASEEARGATLQSYACARRYTLHNTRFGTKAELRVEMRFRRPAAKEFRVVVEKGSRLIRDRVLKRLIQAELEAARAGVLARTRITPENYAFALESVSRCGDRHCYVLQLSPKTPNKFHFRGRIWVDSEDYAISRIEGSPALNPSFWVRKTSFVHEYRKFGPYWLPVTNRSTSEVRIFGRTDVAVDYTDYRLNGAEGDGKQAGGRGKVSLDGVGGRGDDWRAQPANGNNDDDGL